MPTFPGHRDPSAAGQLQQPVQPAVQLVVLDSDVPVLLPVVVLERLCSAVRPGLHAVLLVVLHAAAAACRRRCAAGWQLLQLLSVAVQLAVLDSDLPAVLQQPVPAVVQPLPRELMQQ